MLENYMIHVAFDSFTNGGDELIPMSLNIVLSNFSFYLLSHAIVIHSQVIFVWSFYGHGVSHKAKLISHAHEHDCII